MKPRLYLQKYFVFGLLLPVLASISAAQNFQVRNYTITDGLPSSKVTCTLQDSKGFLWFGTQDGLTRFDGYEFRRFFIEDGLPDNRIEALAEDNSGGLWIGTYDRGISCFHEGKFTNYTKADGLSHNGILCLFKDKKGNIRAGAMRGSALFNGSRWLTVSTGTGISHRAVNTIFEDTRGNLWFGTDAGLFKHTPAQPPSFVFVKTGGDLPIYAGCTDNNDNLYLGTHRGVVKLLQKENYSRHTGTLLADRKISSLLSESGGNLWIGTDNGAVLYSVSTGEVLTYTTRDGLVGDRILSMGMDSRGNYWFTFNMGISYLRRSGFKNYTVREGLVHNMTWSFAEDAGGNIWIGTMNGVSRFDGKHFQNFTHGNSIFKGDVFAIFRDGKENLWFGTGDGVVKYDGDKWIRYNSDSGFFSVRVNSIMEAPNGLLWFGTGDGVSRFDPKKIEFTRYRVGDEPRTNNVKFIGFDTGGQLQALTLHGAWVFANGAFIPHECPKLKDIPIWTSHRDSKGDQWLGTRFGLYRKTGGRFAQYTTRDGLSNNVVYFIEEDDRGILWIGTNRGLNRFDGETFKVYTEDSGLVASETNINASLRDSKGNIWIGTPYGVSVLSGEDAGRTPGDTPIHLTRVTVFDKPVPLDRHLRLKYNENFLRFEFTGLSFESPGSVRYRYRMEGVNTGWQEISERGVSYSYLSPGKYVFKVMARSEESGWSQTPAECRFVILPAFWQTWWFESLAVFLLAGIIVFYYKRRTRKIRLNLRGEAEQKLRVQRVQMEKERLETDLKLKADFTAMLVHDMRSPLNAVMGFADLLSDGPEGLDVKRTGTIISASCRKMLNLINDMLNLSKFEAGKMILHKSNHSLLSVSRDIIEFMQPLVEAQDLRLDCRWDNEEELNLDAEKIGQVIGNLLSNAIKFSPENGNISLVIKRVTVEGEELQELSVIDEGPGIPLEKQKFLFDKYSQLHEDRAIKGTGLGLAVSRLIVEAHGGKIGCRNAETTGSIFYFTLPRGTG